MEGVGVLDAVEPAALASLSASKGRTVGEQFAHIHNVRLMWLKSAAPDLLAGLAKLEKEQAADKKLLRQSLVDSRQATGTLDIEQLGGLAKRMPWVALAFLVGSVAISGLPPFNGFVSEFFIYMGVFQTEQTTGNPLAAESGLGVIAELSMISGFAAANLKFVVPPGAEAHEVKSSWKFAKETTLVQLTPHMHLRGKDFEYIAKYPTGESEILLSVPRYDFNWQHTYVLAQPKLLPAGTVIHITT